MAAGNLNKASIEELLEAEAETVERLADIRKALLEKIDPLIAMRFRIGNSGRFTERERQIFNLATQGKQNKEIACDLRMSLRTVKFHMTNILEKTGATNRRELPAMLALMVFLILACFGNLRAQTITPGAVSTVMSAAQRIASIGMYFPDGNMGAFQLSGTSYVFGPDDGNIGFTGFTLPDLGNWNSGLSLISVSSNIGHGGAGSFDQDYAGGGPVYYDAKDNILIGMYHGEFHYNPPGDGSVEYSSLGLAYSNDLGTNWNKLGEIITNQTTRTGNCNADIGSGSLVAVGIYFYAYYTDTPSGCGNSQVAVARALVTDVIAAAMAGTPFTSGAGTLFMKYTGSGTWTGDGVSDLANPQNGGGAFTAILPYQGSTFFGFPTVAFNAYISQYVICYSNQFISIDCNLSADGVTNWGSPVTAVGGGGSPPNGLYYPTLLNPAGGDPQTLGPNFYVYYDDPFGNWSNTLIKRVAMVAAPAVQIPAPSTITLEWTNPAPPAGQTISGDVVFRAQCTGTVTGSTYPNGAVVGVCSQEAGFSSLYILNSLPNPNCSLSGPYTGCFVDNAIVPGLSYVYEVEAVTSCSPCSPSSAASVPSNTIAVSIPGGPGSPPPPGPVPPPPIVSGPPQLNPPPIQQQSGLALAGQNQSIGPPSIPQTAGSFRGTTERVTATWTDTAGAATYYILWGAGKILQTGAPSATTAGHYMISWSGIPVGQIFLEVCDSQGCSWTPVQ